MRALSMYEGGRFELEEIPVPELTPGWALIRTIASAAGLFQAQMASGMLPTNGFPRILGHEIVGEVVEVSSDAAPQEGSVVVVDAVVGCGVCEWCIRGEDMICPWMRHLGINIDGGFADYVAVPESHIFRIALGTPVEEAVMLGSALPASVHAARRAQVRGGSRVVVTGVGSIGLTLCQVAKAMGATTVVAVDLSDHRLEAAEPWTDGGVNVSDLDPAGAVQQVREAAESPHGVDVVFEAAGRVSSVDLAIRDRQAGRYRAADGYLRRAHCPLLRPLSGRIHVKGGVTGHHLRLHQAGLPRGQRPTRGGQAQPHGADRSHRDPRAGSRGPGPDRRGGNGRQTAGGGRSHRVTPEGSSLPPLQGQPAPVHRNEGTGHEARRFRREEGNHLCDLIGVGRAIQRSTRQEDRPPGWVRQAVRTHRRVGYSGPDDVDPDPVSSEVHRQRLAEQQHASLGRRVGRGAG